MFEETQRQTTANEEIVDPRGMEEAVTSDGDDTVSLQERLERAEQEAATQADKYLRARADMDNFKRRMEQRYEEQSRTVQKGLLQQLLTVKDNIERALHYSEASATSGESLVEGVRLTHYQLDQMLEREGVTPIETVGKPFDPRLEEAIQRVNDPSVPDETVVQEARKGYMHGDQVLRHAQVIVSVHEVGE